MRSKALVVFVLPLLIGLSSCSGNKAKCRELAEVIYQADYLIKLKELQLESLEDPGSETPLLNQIFADGVREDLDEAKEMRRAAFEEFRKLGCE